MFEIVAAMSGVSSALKSASEIVKTLLETRDAAAIRTKVIELSGQIMSAQSSALSAQADQFSLLEKVRSLEQSIADLKAWDSEKERYELVSVAAGVFAYSIKENAQGTEPPHKICANCYQHGEKSILHQETLTPGRAVVLGCQACGAVIYTQGGSFPEHAKRISAYRPAK